LDCIVENINYLILFYILYNLKSHKVQDEHMGYDNLPDSLTEKEVGLTSNETGKKVTRSLKDVLRERYAEITAMDRSIGQLRDFLAINDLKNNTLVWYCGDNGTPSSAARTGMTLRGQKGNMYEGGIRVPGVVEWPAIIKEPGITSAISVTSDILPTLAEMVDLPLPNRPMDGISLIPYFSNTDKDRSNPVYFWSFNHNQAFDEDSKPYIDPKLQEGTTPLVKMMAGKHTRTFRNFLYDEIGDNDFSGNRAMMKNQYKLVLEGQSSDKNGIELFNILNDPGETNNLAGTHPEVVKDMQVEFRLWQESVLNSLKGTDYNTE
jgi:arylsulfatase A-like enzyme